MMNAILPSLFLLASLELVILRAQGWGDPRPQLACQPVRH